MALLSYNRILRFIFVFQPLMRTITVRLYHFAFYSYILIFLFSCKITLRIYSDFDISHPKIDFVSYCYRKNMFHCVSILSMNTSVFIKNNMFEIFSGWPSSDSQINFKSERIRLELETVKKHSNF